MRNPVAKRVEYRCKSCGARIASKTSVVSTVSYTHLGTNLIDVDIVSAGIQRGVWESHAIQRRVSSSNVIARNSR